MIIDPSTGELLQTSRTILHRSRLYPDEAPGLNYRVTFLASGMVIHERTHTLIYAVLIHAHACERILWSACRRVSHRRLAVRAVTGSWHNFAR